MPPPTLLQPPRRLVLDARPLGDRDGTYRKIVAEQIVAHLRLANWRFEKGPPLPRHG